VLFSDESLRAATPADTTAALTVLFDLTRETSRRPDERLATGRRLWVAAQASGRDAEWAPKLAQALREVPAERWGPDFLLGLVRALQRAGFTGEARALLTSNPSLERRMPELTLERAAGLAREGQLDAARPLLDSLVRIWPAARFMRAEFEFFAGEMDSAQAHYDSVAANSDDPDAATALDRIYLLEESPKSPVRPMLGKIAYERWRNHRAAALTLADSLWRTQRPRGEYAAHAGLELAAIRAESGDLRGALAPLLVVCDSLAADRLAPLARQRAGDLYLALGDDKNALMQFEECLARYPRAWNSAEVRRRVERLRKEKRL
jgi:thioredoxin-like negative regulator of GroEL